MRSIAFLASACLSLGSVTPAAASPQTEVAEGSEDPDASLGRLERIWVETLPLYEGVAAEDSLFPELLRRLHWTTEAGVAMQEVWFEPGDEVTRADLDELERKLRNTGLFAEVETEVTPGAEPGTIHVLVRTRDKFTLVLGASGALVGDVGSVRANVGEDNLFGKGDRINLTYVENSEGETDGSIAYTDRHLFDEWLRLRVFGRTTEEGDSVGLRLWRPARQLAEPFEWSVAGLTGTSDVDYFSGGDSVAEVRIDEDRFDLSAGWGSGTRDAYWQWGLSGTFDDTAYGAARGPQAARIDVPGDTTRVRLGPFVRFDRTARFARTTRLDTLGFVQDLRLGGGAELFASAQHRDEEGEDDAVQPVAGARVYGAFAPRDDTYVTLDVEASGRFDDGSTVGSTQSWALHAFHLAPRGHTLAASVTFDDVFEDQGLPREVTLGEDNGLRGYPSREFAGAKRVRVNLEDRVDLDLEVRGLRFGCVAFADAGWIAADGQGLGQPLWSVGVGLRIGSPTLFGGGVLRIDLAFPLDDAGGESYDPLLSVALGQVFSFFGNDSVLSTR